MEKIRRLFGMKPDPMRSRLLDDDAREKQPLVQSKYKDFQDIRGFRFSWIGFVFYYVLGLCTGGLLFLLCFWYPNLATILQRKKSSLADADYVLIYGIDETWEELRVTTIALRTKIAPYQQQNLRLFLYRNVRYVYRSDVQEFSRPEHNFTQPFVDIHELRQGIGEEERESRSTLYGPNLIDIPVKSVFSMLITEVFHPFYIFQMFSCALWFADLYYYYATVIVLMSAASITWTIIFTRSNLIRLREIAHVSCDVNLLNYNSGGSTTVHSYTLVPGDIIEITTSMTLPCDVILLSGECVINESSLTGESIPILKCSLPRTRDVYNLNAHKKHTLFSGTEVLQTSCAHDQSKVFGIVCRTGFATMKGELFHTMLFPKPIHFSFYTESYQFLMIMLLIALGSFGYSAWRLSKEGVPGGQIALKSLDLITIAVPPALPVILTIGIGFALDRLKHKEVYCISPPRINYAGKLNCYCFDKTGTLTEDCLVSYGCHSVSHGRFDPLENEFSQAANPLQSILASTHSISYVGGRFYGHPVDIEMFKATQWLYNSENAALQNVDPALKQRAVAIVSPPGRPNEGIGILRRFEFEAALQRMSVMTIVPSLYPSDPVCVFTKGSPEAVRALCLPETIPQNFEQLLAEYTAQGFYVLGCAYKPLQNLAVSSLDSLTREDIERDLMFAGLLIMENKLKPETPSVIAQLLDAEIKVVVITGDNPYTTAHIAKKCHLISESTPVYLCDSADLKFVNIESNGHSIEDLATPGQFGCEFAITARGIDILLRERRDLVPHIRMFARTTPSQKAQIVECLIDQGYFVGMCGDGTNDCGALKAAHIGLALSDAEASVVSPFTSRRKTISDVVDLIKEGRCALMTSFIAFKYMILYPVIQLLSALHLYNSFSTLGDFQYLYIDVILVLPIAVTMCYTTPWPRLTKDRPTSTLWCKEILISIGVQVILVVVFLVMISFILDDREWFVPIVPPEDPEELVVESDENATTFLFANFQYIIAAIAFSSSEPFRNTLYSNWLYILSLLGTWGLCSYLLLANPFDWIMSLLEIHHMPFYWRLELFGFAIIHLVLSWGFEAAFIHDFGARRFKEMVTNCFCCKRDVVSGSWPV
eukprot:TRINITY_DN10974_c0_g1_i1.p1 TRINITY_DN10974_c0_g1~~TRINITY_DN10974_c0_g1_i1.p1  ORF type:complete len:1106 (-),score=181.90 TRINITY_DN10974_c0_g1_i1:41-3358(-)